MHLSYRHGPVLGRLLLLLATFLLAGGCRREASWKTEKRERERRLQEVKGRIAQLERDRDLSGLADLIVGGPPGNHAASASLRQLCKETGEGGSEAPAVQPDEENLTAAVRTLCQGMRDGSHDMRLLVPGALAAVVPLVRSDVSRQEALDALAEASYHESRSIRCNVAGALHGAAGSIAEDAAARTRFARLLTELVADDFNAVRRNAVVALSALVAKTEDATEHRAGVSALCGALTANGPGVRRNAAASMSKLCEGSDPATRQLVLGSLQQLLTDPVRSCRVTAANALVPLAVAAQDRKALRAAAQAMRAVLAEDDSAVRETAASEQAGAARGEWEAKLKRAAVSGQAGAARGRAEAALKRAEEALERLGDLEQ